MVTGVIKSQFWITFWSGGVPNPFSVTAQIIYLLFAERLDALHATKE